MSERAVERAIRHDLLQKAPRREDIAQAEPIDIHIDIEAVVAAESARLQRAVDERNLEEIIARYPIRETPALDQIAKALRFQDRRQYESTVRKLLMENQEALDFVRKLLGNLSTDIETA